ncbi:MAG: DEAD/DEAH box helicase [Verrucomicrobiota bacterium]
MQGHGPKRIYTPQSIEFWFAKLEDDWELHFTLPQLEAGRRLYVAGEVRELELTNHDAIIHRRVDKHDQYAVIEWVEGGTPTVRSSTTDRELAQAIAIAGLHEIEELVADEASVLPEPAQPAADALHRAVAPPVAGGNGQHGRTSAVAASTPVHSPPSAAKNQSPSVSAVALKARPLLLIFTTTVDGLTFEAHWIGPGKKREPALGAAAHVAGNGHVTPAERTRLIGLAAYARKAHFTYHADTGHYTLGSVAEIPNFLRGTLGAWKKLFTVELDADTTRLGEGTKGIEIEAVAIRRAGGGENGLDLRWIFKAGERLLTDAEVDALLKRGVNPAILPGVGIVSLAAEKLASLNAWRRDIAETHSDGTLPPWLIFSLFNDSRFKLTLSSELEAWRQGVLTPASVAAALPEILRPYQRRGVEWMHHLCDVGCHSLLADEMGLGKTLQVLSLLAARPVTACPSLIVCPASVVPVWREEIARHFPGLAVEVLKAGHDFSNLAPSPAGPPTIWLASYAQLRKHRTLLSGTEFGYAVLDEGQFIKNPDAKVTQTCFAIRAQHRLVLTGTPLENRQLDLWSIFRFLLPGLLGSRTAFESALHADRDAMLTRLRAQLSPFLLRRTKNEVAQELPPKIEMDLLCPLTEVQRAQYAEICREGLERLGNDVGMALREKSFGFLALLTRLRQTCCDPDMLPWLNAPLADSGKLSLLAEKLAEIVGSGHKVVIFSQFVMLLDRVRILLAEKFPELQRFELTGMTLDRQKPVAAFQHAPGAAVMLVSLKAAGTGITLHAADYVFLLDPWWNPAVEAQAVDRVHRIGQKKTVFVYRMVTAGTIEERIQVMKAAKKEMFDRVVGGLGGDFDLGRHFASLQELVQLTTAQVEPELAH